MMRSTLTFLMVLLFSGSLFSQIGGRKTFFELQFGAGPAIMLTDIGNNGYGGNVEVTGKYRIHPQLALKASLGGGLGLGSDIGTENESRGMEYYAFMAEFTGQIEYYILKEGRGAGRGGHQGYKPRVRPYLYAGGGPLFFFPEHTHDNAVELPDFSRYTIILVGGAGFLYRVNSNIFWGFQVGGRLTTTDYLDGFSPSSSKANDNYISIQFLLAYRF